MTRRRDPHQLPLFPNADDEPEKRRSQPRAEPSVGPAVPDPATVRLAERIPACVRLGTSSWAFPGWEGIVWDRRATERVLARSGLAAYACHPLFRAVGIDRTFYAPLRSEQFARYAADVPPDFRFLCKALDAVTSPTIRGRDPAGRSRNEPSPHFLDAVYAADAVIGPFVNGLGDRAGPLVFQFVPLPREMAREPKAFADRLHRFLTALPRGPLYAVELRNRGLMIDAYRQALADAGAAHCINVHPTMPTPIEQCAAVPPESMPAVVIRWMLNSAHDYQSAREQYHPFNRLVDEDVPSRTTLAAVCVAAAARRQPVYVIANNKAEGSAPLTLRRFAEEIVQRANAAGA